MLFDATIRFDSDAIWRICDLGTDVLYDLTVECTVRCRWVREIGATYWQPSEGGYAEDVDVKVDSITATDPDTGDQFEVVLAQSQRRAVARMIEDDYDARIQDAAAEFADERMAA